MGLIGIRLQETFSAAEHQAQQPGGLLRQHVVENQNGRPVCCSALFGSENFR
jgi:hypothetical protein